MRPSEGQRVQSPMLELATMAELAAGGKVPRLLHRNASLTALPAVALGREAPATPRLCILAILQRFAFLQQIIGDTAQVLFHGKERWIITLDKHMR